MILELHRQGVGVSAIARRVDLDRKTVRRYIAQGLEPPAYGPRQPRVSLLRAFEPYLRELLAAFPQLTGRRLHRELRELGYSGGYTILTDLLRRDPARRGVTVRNPLRDPTRAPGAGGFRAFPHGVHR